VSNEVADGAGTAGIAVESGVPGLEQAIGRAVAHLLEVQQPAGYWWGGLEGSPASAAEYILLTSFLGVQNPRREAIASNILACQGADGAWSRYPGGPGDLSLTVECVLALQLAGEDPVSPPLAAAREWVRARGGAAKARLLTRFWLALFGQVSWRALPAIPPELIFLPPPLPLGIHDFPAWTRTALVPLSIVWAKRPVRQFEEASLDDLYLDPRDRRRRPYGHREEILSWKSFFLTLDRWLHGIERLPTKVWRPAALGRATKWLLEHQEADGAWAGSFPATAWSLVALACLGREDDASAIDRGLSALNDEFLLDTCTGTTVQPALTPVSDTALAVCALHDAGVPSDHSALQAAARWLLGAQSFTPGDWQATSPETDPGGWPASFCPDHYPDVAVTAQVMSALLAVDLPEAERRPALERGLRWLLGMQSSDGGWASLDRGGGRAALAHIPFLEFEAPVGRPSVDITSAVVEMLTAGGRGREYEPVARAIAFLLATQEPDGAWAGDRAVHYLYGTFRAVSALAGAGGTACQERVTRAVLWFEGHQTAAGGWGETPESYADPTLRGLGPETASQTAWGLLALVAAGQARGDAARRAAEYLVRSQSADGTWEEHAFTARTPGGAPARARLWRTCYPLMALARYRAALDTERMPPIGV